MIGKIACSSSALNCAKVLNGAGTLGVLVPRMCTTFGAAEGEHADCSVITGQAATCAATGVAHLHTTLDVKGECNSLSAVRR